LTRRIQRTSAKMAAVGAKISGINGLTVGRTIFMQPLYEYKAGIVSQNEVVEKNDLNYTLIL
jgi:myo-inositol catabolism protein IolC